MAKKENNYYFDTFTKSVSYACDATALLQDCFSSFNPDTLHTHMEEMHKIEHAADEVKHDMMQQLVKEFLPPIEREDIMELAHTIDNVTDNIEDVLQQMYMMNITSLRPDAKEFTDVISKCCSTMRAMTLELHNFRKPAHLLKHVIEINHLEEEGDRLYLNVMHRLHAEEKDPITIIAWTNIYSGLEKCCDSCEDVADVVEQVIMKNN